MVLKETFDFQPWISQNICQNYETSFTSFSVNFCPNAFQKNALESPWYTFLENNRICCASSIPYDFCYNWGRLEFFRHLYTMLPQFSRNDPMNEVESTMSIFLWKVWSLSFTTHFLPNHFDYNLLRTMNLKSCNFRIFGNWLYLIASKWFGRKCVVKFKLQTFQRKFDIHDLTSFIGLFLLNWGSIV